MRQVSGDLMALALCPDSCCELASCTSENSLTRCLQYRNVLNCIAANLENTQGIYENCPSQGMTGHYKVPGMVRAVEQRCRNCMEAFSRLILLKLFVNSGAEKGRIYYPRKGLKKITQNFLPKPHCYSLYPLMYQ